MNSETKLTVVLLSDMHFGSDVEGQWRMPAIEITPRWLKWLSGRKIKKYFKKRCIAHDVNVLRALPNFLRYLKINKGVGDFDLYVVLGDVVTWPSESAFTLASQYLTCQSVSDIHDTYKTECKGLGISPDKLLVIPGNHDKMLLTGLDSYNTFFANPLNLLNLPKGGSVFKSYTLGKTTLLFMLLDGNAYAEKGLSLDPSYKKHLACGKIEKDAVDQLRDKIGRLRQGQEVDQATVADFNSAIKFLIVHYAVKDWEAGGKGQAGLDMILPHQCEGLDNLVGDLWDQKAIDVVLHGHLHQPSAYNYRGAQVLGVTTTTQLGGRNGFYLLTITPGELTAENYKWQGHFFGEDKDHTVVIQIAR